jgi:hypothetical protein
MRGLKHFLPAQQRLNEPFKPKRASGAIAVIWLRKANPANSPILKERDMTISASLQDVTRAEPHKFDGFSLVQLYDAQNATPVFNLFLPVGKAEAVAEAINAAIESKEG